ncbi:hypothetical protein KR018_002407 [Drosophila ironensis]|nr:hypothetical protein KR018_002407 [Drosophila ironensis]
MVLENQLKVKMIVSFFLLTVLRLLAFLKGGSSAMNNSGSGPNNEVQTFTKYYKVNITGDNYPSDFRHYNDFDDIDLVKPLFRSTTIAMNELQDIKQKQKQEQVQYVTPGTMVQTQLQPPKTWVKSSTTVVREPIKIKPMVVLDQKNHIADEGEEENKD